MLAAGCGQSSEQADAPAASPSSSTSESAGHAEGPVTAQDPATTQDEGSAATTKPRATPEQSDAPTENPTMNPLPSTAPTQASETPSADAEDDEAQDFTPALKPTKPTRTVTSEMRVNPEKFSPGLVTTLSSFTKDKAAKNAYKAGGQCMAETVLDAGFSDKAINLLAGGPKLGAKAEKDPSITLSDFLPTPSDRDLWNSPDFTQALVECTVADPTQDA
jgi:hypothetical protein